MKDKYGKLIKLSKFRDSFKCTDEHTLSLTLNNHYRLYECVNPIKTFWIAICLFSYFSAVHSSLKIKTFIPRMPLLKNAKGC